MTAARPDRHDDPFRAVLGAGRFGTGPGSRREIGTRPRNLHRLRWLVGSEGHRFADGHHRFITGLAAGSEDHGEFVYLLDGFAHRTELIEHLAGYAPDAPERPSFYIDLDEADPELQLIAWRNAGPSLIASSLTLSQISALDDIMTAHDNLLA